MAVGDTVSGFTGTFQPAAAVQVIIFWAGIPSGASSTGITDGGSSAIVYVPAYNSVVVGGGAYANLNTPTQSPRTAGVWKIPIDNTNYFLGSGGYAGIQIK
jgi:hypothetical protein